MITLITSAAYVNGEMVAEFGRLPPAMLPLGTSRIIYHQIEALGPAAGRVFLSLPESYSIDAPDQEKLRQLDVSVLRVPDDLTLGRSILHCLSSPHMVGPLAILHGDTLLSPPAVDGVTDSCVVAPSPGPYSWGRAYVADGRFLGADNEGSYHAREAPQNHDVLVGYFTFKRAEVLRTALMQSNGDFLTALSRVALTSEVSAPTCDEWSDFGHLQTYFRSRAAFASVRSFNNLRIERGVAHKTGDVTDKIGAEATWFDSLPASVRIYSARLLDSSRSSDGRWRYSTEYEFLPTLQELFVFGDLPDEAWDRILDACTRCLTDFSVTPVEGTPPNALQILTREKTLQRLDVQERQSGLDLSRGARLNGIPLPSPRQIADEMIAVVAGAEVHPASVMHGDFCFSNILFNSRTQRVRLIDPRGTLDGKSFTCGGDVRYDMAKLAHSIVGWYDLVIAGRLTCRWNGGLDFDLTFPSCARNERLVHELLGRRVGAIPFGDPVILASMILLFLSMLPLHDDRPDRQTAFLANALRLYDIFFARS